MMLPSNSSPEKKKLAELMERDMCLSPAPPAPPPADMLKLDADMVRDSERPSLPLFSVWKLLLLALRCMPFIGKLLPRRLVMLLELLVRASDMRLLKAPDDESYVGGQLLHLSGSNV